jgi:D-lactate dehydrogenase
VKVAFFSSHRFDRQAFERENSRIEIPHSITFLEARLAKESVVLARGHEAVCLFVSDSVTEDIAQALFEGGTRLIALRSAGFNHVDIRGCDRIGLTVVRVPAYSPHAVSEHALALLLALNRKIHRAYNRVRELNFSIDGLQGVDLFAKTIGVIGTGKIGECFARAMLGLGCRVVAHDPNESASLRSDGVVYTDLDDLFRQSDVISLHAPLTPATRHLVGATRIAAAKTGVILVNTSRGGLIDTTALIEGLKSGHIGGAALDVYEEEEGIFFEDLSETGVSDDTLARLLTFPNVLVTSHQAFLTEEALRSIAQTTLENMIAFKKGLPLLNQVTMK